MGVVVVHALALDLRVGCPTISTSARGQPSAAESREQYSNAWAAMLGKE
jgi:hypothetical protein